jgi:5-methylthioribose kinase
VLPFLDANGFALDSIQPGLEELAAPFKTDTALKAVVSNLGERYLVPGTVLLHGDYYPGSWVQASGTVYVIDPEFSFAGFAEFDLGVMAAHLLMATMEPEVINQAFERYAGHYNRELAVQIAGTEILRRLIGLAQLPLVRSLEEKAYLLRMARNFLMHAS